MREMNTSERNSYLPYLHVSQNLLSHLSLRPLRSLWRLPGASFGPRPRKTVRSTGAGQMSACLLPELITRTYNPKRRAGLTSTAYASIPRRGGPLFTLRPAQRSGPAIRKKRSVRLRAASCARRTRRAATWSPQSTPTRFRRGPRRGTRQRRRICAALRFQRGESFRRRVEHHRCWFGTMGGWK